MSEQGYEAQGSLEELDNYLEGPANPDVAAQPAEPTTPAAALAQPYAPPAQPYAPVMTQTLPPLPARPLPPPRKAQGKGWVTLWKVTAWLACVLIIAGGTAWGLSYVNENYGVFTGLEPILVLAAFILVSVVAGLAVLAGVMVVCGIFRELAATRSLTEQLRRRQ